MTLNFKYTLPARVFGRYTCIGVCRMLDVEGVATTQTTRLGRFLGQRVSNLRMSGRQCGVATARAQICHVSVLAVHKDSGTLWNLRFQA